MPDQPKRPALCFAKRGCGGDSSPAVTYERGAVAATPHRNDGKAIPVRCAISILKGGLALSSKSERSGASGKLRCAVKRPLVSLIMRRRISHRHPEKIRPQRLSNSPGVHAGSAPRLLWRIGLTHAQEDVR